MTQPFLGQMAFIYRLVMRNPSFQACFRILIFWAFFGVKMGVAAMLAFKGLGPQNPTKNLTHLVTCYLENKFSKFSAPLPPHTSHTLIL